MIAKRTQIRLLLGDTDFNAVQGLRLEDEEIDYIVATYGTVENAAPYACDSLVAKFAHRRIGTTGNQDDRRYEWLKSHGMMLRARAAQAVAIGATGISASDKQTAEEDTDRVVPSFKVDMLDTPDARQGTGQPDPLTSETS